MKRQIVDLCSNLTDEEFRKVISNIKKKLVEKDDIFKGGVIIRNPEKRTETMKKYYECMINLNKE